MTPQVTENAEAAASLLSLCELTVTCPCNAHDDIEEPDLETWITKGGCSVCWYADGHDGDCTTCQGTGQVAKYGMLRERVVATAKGVPISWELVSREKAGTKIQKLPECRSMKRALDNSYWAVTFVRQGIIYRGQAEDAGNATIAALWKMEQAQ